MTALHITNNLIDNIIVVNRIIDMPDCIAYIEGAEIGDSVINGKLVKKVIPETEQEKEIRILKAQLTAATERADFIDECIAEMANIVYA